MKRYVVYNPWENAAALSIDPAGSWSIPERWDREVWSLASIGSELLDGWRLPLRLSWVSDTECPELVAVSYPCGDPLTQFAQHIHSNGASAFTCAPLPAPASGPMAPEVAAQGSQLLHSQWALGAFGQALPAITTPAGAGG